MNDGFPALDIIFFAMVAVFLVLRLRSVLGRRTGNERRPPEGGWNAAPPPAADERTTPPNRDASSQPGPREGEGGAADNVVDLAGARKGPANIFDHGAQEAPAPQVSGLAAVIAADPSFSERDFLAGARMAFEMIVSAYASGDKKALRPLLADQVYKPFSDAIDARARAGEELSTELMGIRSAELVDARMVGSAAHVTIRFVSEQINVVKTLDGRIIDGDPAHVVDVVDEWTFRRDTRSRDPNWQLAGTRAPAGDADKTSAD